ncbi:MAG TPA: hypothetical protein PK006_02015 [Saprospiraceae bacterium]|nr:hypothetical protein [Saprospiraceae bacterium]
MNKELRQHFQNKLYEPIDPLVPKPNHNYYVSTVTLTEWIKGIDLAIQTNK